ncbi:MAG TPA: hypothetical protein VGJ94_09235 [Syntrophorhabdaceae bacterium]
MPLSFQSSSHGEVAFGFFNIETDMMLLNQYFFFARDFADLVAGLALHPSGPAGVELAAYILPEKERGNLMGAIHGIDYRGFLGDTYRLYPFPREPSGFKQNPEGFRTRGVMEELIARYAPLTVLTASMDGSGASIFFGEYSFTRYGFHELVRYVFRGGLPGWKDEVRPDYVRRMREAVERSTHPLFGFTLTG